MRTDRGNHRTSTHGAGISYRSTFSALFWVLLACPQERPLLPWAAIASDEVEISELHRKNLCPHPAGVPPESNENGSPLIPFTHEFVHRSSMAFLNLLAAVRGTSHLGEKALTD